MQNAFWTVRRKMLLPTWVAAAAVFLATFVTLALSGKAARLLEKVETVDLAVLRFDQDMLDSLKVLRLQLLRVGDAEDMSLIQDPDDLKDEMLGRIHGDGARILNAAEAQKLEAQLEEYYGAARELAARRVAAGLKKKRIESTKTNDVHIYATSTPEERAMAAAASEVENKYGAIEKRFVDEVKRSNDNMKAAFEDTKRQQSISIWLGAIILLAAAAGAGLFAWIIAVKASRPLQTLSEVALRVAAGDLTQRVHVESGDEVGVLAQSFGRMVERLRELVGTLKSAANELALAAEQLSDHTRAQSAMLERQASGVAETSATTRELEQSSSVAARTAASVVQVARHAAEMSDQGRDAAEKSAGELQRIQASVESIVGQSAHMLEQARQVGDIVETVRDLATQSHVLSLNASIEAVKAGEAGKSFAVVAQEVRALAEQSGQSASSIGKIVEDMLAAVQGTLTITERGSQGMTGSLNQIRASGESLREIGSIVRETSEAALQIAAAVQQQSKGIGQIAAAMRDIDRGMEDTVGRIRALELSSQQVAETATRISGIAAEFTI
jgi:methyl-accepting chemotaxis protein